MKTYLQIAILILTVSWSGAETVLIKDDFTSPGKLAGQTPAVCLPNDAGWLASKAPSCYESDGSGLIMDLAAERTALLDLGEGYLAANPGAYTLSTEVSFSSTQESAAWVALGFSGQFGGETSFSMSDERGGAPWILLRANGALEVYAGPGASKTLVALPAGTFSVSESCTLQLVLHVEEDFWGLEAFVNGEPLDLDQDTGGSRYTFITAPSARFVGISNVQDKVSGTAPVVTARSFQLLFEPAE